MKEQRKIYFSRYLDKCSSDRLVGILITIRKIGLHKKKFALDELPYSVYDKLFFYYTSRK